MLTLLSDYQMVHRGLASSSSNLVSVVFVQLRPLNGSNASLQGKQVAMRHYLPRPQ
jgi:hypothetical protein